jgi:methylthioribose-1-phosphate isomerase
VIHTPSSVSSIIDWIEDLVKTDLETNKSIGKYGADAIMATIRNSQMKINVLTHCNTGSLATSGYGTALGVVRALHAQGTLGRLRICVSGKKRYFCMRIA